MIFGAINTAGSGLTTYRTWLDAVSDNVANINDMVPGDQPSFQERFVNAVEKPDANGNTNGIGSGVQVAGIRFGDTEGRKAFQPDSPLADAQGYVKYPDIDLGEQMAQMMVAQRAYQANLATIDRAKDAYQAALELGK
jgi:flagellar basal-body rod protein FlgC